MLRSPRNGWTRALRSWGDAALRHPSTSGRSGRSWRTPDQAKVNDADHEGVFRVRVEKNEGNEEIVPDSPEVQNGHGRERRPGQGQHHAQVDHEVRAAVDFG